MRNCLAFLRFCRKALARRLGLGAFGHLWRCVALGIVLGVRMIAGCAVILVDNACCFIRAFIFLSCLGRRCLRLIGS